jgi:hypothetical protein
MSDFGPVLILLLLTSIVMHIHTAYRLRAISNKMRWYRIHAIKTNGMLRKDMNELAQNSLRKKVGAENNELDASIGKS